MSLRNFWVFLICTSLAMTTQAAKTVRVEPVSPAASVPHTELEGVSFPLEATVSNTPLVLNGVGVRKRFIFKVMVAGLYLQHRSDQADKLFAATDVRRYRVVFLRDVDGKEFEKMFLKTLELNVNKELFPKLIPSVIQISEAFAKKKKMYAGDSFTLDWVPSMGMLLSINDKLALAEPIREPEFYNAVLRAVVGPEPVDKDLKRGLLGKLEPTQPTNP